MYDEFTRLDRDHWWFRARRRIVADVADRYIPHNRGPVLDVGCGTGGMVPVLSRFGPVTGLDSSPKACAAARKTHGCPVIEASFPCELGHAGSFAMITAFDMLEHVEDDAQALNAMYRALMPGGHVCVTVPAHMWLWSRHDDANQHRRRYARRELFRKMSNAGFRIQFYSFFNTWLSPAVLLIRLAQKAVTPVRQGPSDSSDFRMPPSPVNALLESIMASERFWLRRGALPCGVSIIAVGSKPIGGDAIP